MNQLPFSTTSLEPTDLGQSAVREWFEESEGCLIRRVACGSTSGRSRALNELTSVEDPAERWDQQFMQGKPVAYGRDSGTIHIVDFFSGGGGLSFGASEIARSIGLEPCVQLAVDSDPLVTEVYAVNNHPREVSNLSFEKLTGWDPSRHGGAVDIDRFDRGLADLVGKVDLFLAGPPCQGFSNLNNSTRRDDDRNDLYAATVGLAIELEVPLILIENLPEVRADKRMSWVRAQCMLLAAGYNVDAQVIAGLAVGVAQTRRRMFLAASRYGKVDLLGAVAAFRRPVRDLAWAIADLEATSPDHEFDRPADLSQENIARISHLFETGAFELDNEHRPECHRNGHTYGAVYGRLHYDRPAPTITSGFFVPGRGRYIHPTQRRTLTPHEAARIQGFPDSFRFADRSGKALPRRGYAKVIGNAVPPQMARVAAAALLATVPHSTS